MSNIKLKFISLLSISLLFVINSCVMSGTNMYPPSFKDQTALENSIKDLTHAESVKFSIDRTKYANNKTTITEFRIDVFNASPTMDNDNQTAKQIIIISKDQLQDTSHFNNYIVNFISEKSGGLVTKKNTKAFSFKPEEL